MTGCIRAVRRVIDIMGDIKAASDERTRGVEPANVQGELIVIPRY